MKYRLRPRSVVLFLLLACLAVGLLFQNPIRRLFYPKQYDRIIMQYAEEYELPIHFVCAVIKAESNFDPNAESSAGAIGLMQIMPSTFQWLQDMTGDHYPNGRLTDPTVNIRYGCLYLAYLYDLYGDKALALAAYNAGPGNVNRWLADKNYSENGKLVNIPFEETKNYINRVLRFEEIYETLYPEKGQKP